MGRRRLPPPAAAGAVLAALLAACAPGTAGPPDPVAAVAEDPGAAARAAALARVDGDRVRWPEAVPDIVGRTPAAAQAALAADGLEVFVVAFDGRRTVTQQWPPAGAPVPLDGVVEAWLGTPPPDADGPTRPGAAAAAAAAADTEDTADTADTAPAGAAVAAAGDPPAASGEPAAATAAGGPAYILPPHTPGRLRTNPRLLPALPLGTELTGTASWYGPGFHGLRTACGGIYDQNGATIAARELRCGTVVRITGPTGRTVEATVTDWGPAEWTGRRFDLSAAVFNAIAPLGAGVVPVRVITANVPS